MPKTIKIKKLSLTNYRNITAIDLDLAGKSGQIEGRNRVGKTNVLEAIVWLFTDHLLGSSSDIQSVKPKDDTRKTVSAKAILDVDGDEVTVQKDYYETWVRHRGEAEPTMEGHTTDYYVNGAKVGRFKDFAAKLGEKFGCEQSKGSLDLYQLLMDPFYFPSICFGKDWKLARSLIIDIVGDVTPSDVYKAEPKALIAKEALERHQYDDGEAKRELKGLIDAETGQILAKEAVVAEYRNTPEPEADAVVAAEEKVSEINSAIDKIANGESSAYDAQISETLEKLSKAKTDLANSAKYPTLDNSKSEAVRAKLDAKRKEMWDASGKLREAQDKRNSIKSSLDVCAKRREGFVAHLNGIKSQIAEYKAADVCPTCGQQLPADMVAKAKEAFMSKLKAEGDKAMADGKANKAEADALAQQLAAVDTGSLEIIAAMAKADAEKLASDYSLALAEEAKQDRAPTFDQSIKDKVAALEAELAELRAKKSDAIGKAGDKIAEERAKLAPYKAILDAKTIRDNAVRQASKAEAELAGIRSRLADDEQKAEAIGLYMKAKLGLLDEHIAKVFGSIRFQLISPNIRSGSYDEVCKPYIFDFKAGKSKPILFDSGSKSEQIRTGTLILSALARAEGWPTLPIVFDQGGEMDADSVAGLEDDTAAQVLSAKVTDGFSAPTFVSR